MLYPINTIIAIDQATGARVENGSGYVYAVSDTARATPLSIFDLSGLPLTSNLLTTNSEALIPPFQVEGEWQVVFVSGDSEIILTSWLGLKEEAAASASAANAVETKANNGEFKGEQGDSAYQVWLSLGNAGTVEDYRADIEGPPGKDGSNVLPTDEAIEQAVTTDGTATNAALKATLGPNAQVASGIVARRIPQAFGQVAAPRNEPVVKTFNPTPSEVTPATTDLTWTDVDASNLSVTFVVPPSGKVLLRMTAQAAMNAGVSALRWAVRDSAGLILDSRMAAIQSTSTTSASPTKVTTVNEVSVDSTGTPLVPGNLVTWTWQQQSSSSGVQGSTQYGGLIGPAVMEVVPVSSRLTERPATATIATTTYEPLWLTHDRTILGSGTVAPYALAWSTDDGATWTEHTHTFPGGVQQVRETGTGELVVFTGWVGGANPEPIAVWKSDGWTAGHATATFTRVHQGAGPDITVSGGNWAAWSVDAFGDVVVCAEYGPKAGDGNMARYVFLSEDGGDTFTAIFDLAAQLGGAATSQHLHGVCYDPWWDAIWVANGDGDAQSANWVSFDRGTTWKNLNQNQQFTSVYALPEGIIWVTDEGEPNGFYRIPRTHPDSLTWEIAHIQDTQTGLTILGTQMFRSRTVAGAPLLMSNDTGNISGPARLFATYDGYTFREVWNDTGQSYVNKGLKSMVGPTASGKYIGTLERGDGISRQLTIEVN